MHGQAVADAQHQRAGHREGRPAGTSVPATLRSTTITSGSAVAWTANSSIRSGRAGLAPPQRRYPARTSSRPW
ncbi:hypothetical protein [Streptomyces sp. NPDC093260]|uniref:hypothetical protein n=1 Tax=Streptomyces sp. NPDC093260 TaxID=3155073 RepID=UPI00341668EC